MLTTATEAAKRIKAGERLLLAAEERQLLALPSGTWIGGTIPYFMGERGGEVSREAVFVTSPPPRSATSRSPSTIQPLCRGSRPKPPRTGSPS